MMGRSQTYESAIALLSAMNDAELIEFHREVSRAARSAYGRTDRYQANYRQGMACAQPKIEAWNARLEAFAANNRGMSVAEYRRARAAVSGRLRAAPSPATSTEHPPS